MKIERPNQRLWLVPDEPRVVSEYKLFESVALKIRARSTPVLLSLASVQFCYLAVAVFPFTVLFMTWLQLKTLKKQWKVFLALQTRLFVRQMWASLARSLLAVGGVKCHAVVLSMLPISKPKLSKGIKSSSVKAENHILLQRFFLVHSKYVKDHFFKEKFTLVQGC